MGLELGSSGAVVAKNRGRELRHTQNVIPFTLGESISLLGQEADGENNSRPLRDAEVGIQTFKSYESVTLGTAWY